MAAVERVPGTGLYVLAGVIALASTVAAGGIGLWLFLEHEAAVPFLAPGKLTVELNRPGSYFVWNDYRTVFQGRSYDESKHLPSGARISVIEKASGRELPVGSHSGATSASGSTESVAVAQFSIGQAGSYDIDVQGTFPPRVMSVGRNMIYQLVGGLFGAFALVFVGYSAALVMAGWVFLKREEAARIATLAAGPAVAGPPAPPGEKALKQLTAIVYGLQIAAFLVGITFIAGVIINYLKRKDAEGTWLESHFRWQIRTFWYGLLWSLIGFVLAFVLVGFLVLMGTAVWVLYRAIRGWVQLEEGKAMYS